MRSARYKLWILLTGLLILWLHTAPGWAQTQGIWKDTPTGTTHNFYIQNYETGSTIVIYTPDGLTFYAFQADIVLNNFQADSLDPDSDRRLRIEFSSDAEAVATLWDLTTGSPEILFEEEIEKIFDAIRTDHSGIWKDASSSVNLYVQEYAAGGMVVVYTFDAETFQAFVGDPTDITLVAPSLGDGSEEIEMEFSGAGQGVITVHSVSADPLHPQANNFGYQVFKLYPPAPLDIDYTASPTSGAAPLSVQFTDTSNVMLSAYDWDFGDGGMSTDQNPQHTYASPGAYDVWRTVVYNGVAFISLRTEYISVSSSGTHAISGAVTVAPGGTPLSGVTISGDNGAGSTNTDASGNYSLPVPDGWSGTITPSLGGYTFAPSSKGYTNVTADVTGEDYEATATSPQTVTLSGIVVEDSPPYNPIPDVTISYTNGGGTTTTDASGHYSKQLTAPYTGTATPSKSGWTFVPPSLSYGAVNTNLIDQNFEGTSTGGSGHIVSGRVIFVLGGSPMQNVTVTFSGGLGSVTTDANGDYGMQVPDGWSGTVTPSLSGYTFDPTSRSYTNVVFDYLNQNFTGFVAAQATVFVSGTISFTLGGTPLQGVTVTFSGGAGSTTTDANGEYSYGVPAGWNGTVTPSLSGYTFDPTSRSYTDLTSSVNNQDYTGFYAAQIMVFISGNISFVLGGSPMQGVTVTFSDGAGSTTTDANGDYAYGVPAGWSGTVTPSLSGYVFEPSNKSYTDVTANTGNQDYVAFIAGYTK